MRSARPGKERSGVGSVGERLLANQDMELSPAAAPAGQRPRSAEVTDVTAPIATENR
jgi:hypothetical protein